MFTRGPTYDKIKFRVPLPGAKLTRAAKGGAESPLQSTYRQYFQCKGLLVGAG